MGLALWDQGGDVVLGVAIWGGRVGRLTFRVSFASGTLCQHGARDSNEGDSRHIRVLGRFVELEGNEELWDREGESH